MAPENIDHIQAVLLQNQLAAVVCGIIYLLPSQKEQSQRVKRRFWVHPWILHCPSLITYDQIIAELQRKAKGDFRSFLQVEPDMFHEILVQLTPHLRKERNFQHPLAPRMKLAGALHYFATRKGYQSLNFTFRVLHNTISPVLREISAIILTEYQDEVFMFPTTPIMWRDIAHGFAS